MEDIHMTNPDTVQIPRATVEAVREALKPFVVDFEKAAEGYAARYGKNGDIGISNFDKMPDEWTMDRLTFSMGDFRKAAAALALLDKHNP